jgi:peptide/nickel transport system substrate-binding protein
VAAVLRLIFEPLVVLDAEKRPMPNPAITQGVVFSADGRALAVSLHDDIFWEDGSPITSADIAFSIDVLRFSAPEGAIFRPNVANIASHTVLDGRTLQINLHNPTWAMKYMLNFPIIPADYYRHVPMTNLRAARNMHPLGNGPFRFLSYDAAGSLELIANEHAPGGVPYISGATAMILRDIDGARYAFEQGLTDAFAAGPYHWGRYSAMGKNRAAEVLTGHFDFVGFNTRNPLFAVRDAREAVAQSFNLEAARQRYYTQSDAAIAPINPESWLAVDAYNLRPHGYDPDRAAWYFAQLGETQEITIIVNAENPEGIGTANILAAGLAEAGVVVNLEVLPFADFSARAEARDFDMIVGGVEIGAAPDFAFIYAILGYSSEEFNLVLSMMRNAASEGALIQAAAAAQHHVADNLPLIGVAFRRQVLYTAGHVHGDIEISPMDIFANVGNWFIYSP